MKHPWSKSGSPRVVARTAYETHTAVFEGKEISTSITGWRNLLPISWDKIKRLLRVYSMQQIVDGNYDPMHGKTPPSHKFEPELDMTLWKTFIHSFKDPEYYEPRKWSM